MPYGRPVLVIFLPLKPFVPSVVFLCSSSSLGLLCVWGLLATDEGSAEPGTKVLRRFRLDIREKFLHRLPREVVDSHHPWSCSRTVWIWH